MAFPGTQNKPEGELGGGNCHVQAGDRSKRMHTDTHGGTRTIVAVCRPAQGDLLALCLKEAAVQLSCFKTTRLVRSGAE